MKKAIEQITIIVCIALFLTVIAVCEGVSQGTPPKPSETQTSVSTSTADKPIEPIKQTYTQTQYTPYIDYVDRVAVDIKTTEAEIQAIARVMYSECRGVKSRTEQAAVAWCILNRVDSDSSDFRDSIIEVITQANQFAYNSESPILPELEELAEDVVNRWLREKAGETEIGRVLPKDYVFFEGDGERNYFRTAYRRPYQIWEWSLESPYEN